VDEPAGDGSRTPASLAPVGSVAPPAAVAPPRWGAEAPPVLDVAAPAVDYATPVAMDDHGVARREAVAPPSLRSTPEPAPEVRAAVAEVPKVEVAPEAVASAADRELARDLAATLAPVASFDVAAQLVDGATLLTVRASGIEHDELVAAARRVLPVLAARRPWPVDQVTLRGARAADAADQVALVVTPLGRDTGAPVLAAAIESGGALALLEMRCRAAAAARRPGRDAARDTADRDLDDHEETDLLEMEPSTRVREVASRLQALGPVGASALRDAESDRVLYLFLPPGSDVRAVGALASDVARAMRGRDGSVVFRTAVLRSGPRRIIVRLPAGPSSRTDTIVAAGETERPGLAYRQVERAAAALGAL
jgi:hypothetical protein